MEEEKSIKDLLLSIDKKMDNATLVEDKKKNFKLPRKAKLRNSHLRKGYCSVILLQENGAVDIIKEPIVDSTVKIEDTYHYVGGNSVLNYKGKPMIIISKIKRDAWDPYGGNNETKGQKHIMTRMMNEVIQAVKKKMGMGLSIGLIIVVGIIVYVLVRG